jgi:PIN domain nuclease of toxin-antitoxin system
VRLLLDTNVILWAAVEPERLGAAIELMESSDNELLVSAASAWGIAVKYAIDKLPLPKPLSATCHTSCTNSVPHRSPSNTHMRTVAALPSHHRAPFDRLLVTQARLLRVPLVTSDAALRMYDIEVVPTG